MPVSSRGPFRDLVRDYGAVLGPSASIGQQSSNVRAFQDACADAQKDGAGAVVLPGTMMVNDALSLENLGDAKFELWGVGFGSRIVYDGATGPFAILSLRGTRRLLIRSLTLLGNNKARYGLYTARRVYPETAGKHIFELLAIYDCTVSPHLCYGSEENQYRKCQFQRSPLGPIFTAHAPVGDPTVLEAAPIDYAAPYHDCTANFAYGCAFGSDVDSNPTTRTGLVIAEAQLTMFGGVIQTSKNAEAGCIIDGSRWYSTFDGVNWDSGLPRIGLKVGAFSQQYDEHRFANRLLVRGGDLTVSESGSAFVDAWNLRQSFIGPIRMEASGVVPFGSFLRDDRCRGNTILGYANDDTLRPVIETWR